MSFLSTLDDEEPPSWIFPVNFTSDIIARQPQQVKVPSAHLLHIGKSGGGTAKERLNKYWKVLLDVCHPRPCGNQAKLKPSKKPLNIVTLRDPVDRFISAFYWRSHILCHPEKDKRVGPPSQECHSDRGGGQMKEAKIIYFRYRLNASLLAEDLCSVDAEKASTAVASLNTIGHAQYNINDWLKFNWHADRLYPLVIEGGNFEAQVDMAVHWLYHQEKFENSSMFENRVRYVSQEHLVISNLRHSSGSSKMRLSNNGEQCLERYYRKDYELLQKLLDTACKSKACHNGIKSILDRRKRTFEDLG